MIGSWIASHALVVYLDIELFSPYLRIQSGCNVQGAVPASVNCAIDVEAVLSLIGRGNSKLHLLAVAVRDLPATSSCVLNLQAQSAVTAPPQVCSQRICVHPEI